MSSSKNRQLAAILFADIVSYTAIMQKEESDALTILTRYQSVLKETAESYDGEIIKSYGDGSLLLFSSTVNAVECAQDMQLAFRDEPKVAVRIGIHVGEFVRKGQDVFGNGINIAARIESVGIAGSVLFSNDVAKRIKNHPEFETLSLGDFQFKHVEEKIEVFALTGDGFSIPKRTGIKAKAKSYSKSYKWQISTMMGAFLIAGFAFWKFSSPNLTAKKTTSVATAETAKKRDNSLAVLPFANLSPQQEDAYFSDGMHDDLLSHLSKIGSMKVISRTSVLRFKEGKEPLFEIANKLGVANILEGSVRRAGKKLRVNVQLIQAKTGTRLWSETYDRSITTEDIFDIQTAIAKEIADALQTTISPTQRVALETQPTQNLEAYEAYLKGRHLVEERIASSIEAAKKYLEKAIFIDPNFAQAYIKLGEIYYLLVEYGGADSKTNYALAWDYLEKAKNINPNLAEIHGLECTLYHYDRGDIGNARKAYIKATAINPNYADVYFWYSHAVIEIEKDFELALVILQNALRLDPLSAKFINRMAQTQLDNGEKEAALTTYLEGIELAPNHVFLQRNMAFLYAHIGQLDSAAIIAYETIKSNSNDPKYLRTYIYLLAELEMSSEIGAELAEFKIDSRLDSLYFFRFKVNQTLQQGNFSEAEKYLQILLNMDKDAQKFDPTLLPNLYYYKKDFQKVVTLFEENYPDVLNVDYFKNTMFSGYNRRLDLQESLQKYIYSLCQIDQKEKAKQLLEKYGDLITANINPKGDQIWETKKRILFEVRNTIMKGQPDIAMSQLAKNDRGKVSPEWAYLLIDPMFDDFKEDTRYLLTIDALQADIDKQRANFRSYLLQSN